jgi:hypothetical protein
MKVSQAKRMKDLRGEQPLEEAVAINPDKLLGRLRGSTKPLEASTLRSTSGQISHIRAATGL